MDICRAGDTDIGMAMTIAMAMADLLPPVGDSASIAAVSAICIPEPRYQLHKDPATDDAAIDFGVASIEMHFGV